VAAQIERLLQREIALRLRAAPLSAKVIGSPNGAFFPARTPIERALVKRIVHQLKVDGQLTPGAPDLLFLWRGGCGCVELKRPASRTLLTSLARGVASPEQQAFRDDCEQLGIPYVICSTWDEVRETLVAWGRLPADWPRRAVA